MGSGRCHCRGSVVSSIHGQSRRSVQICIRQGLVVIFIKNFGVHQRHGFHVIYGSVIIVRLFLLFPAVVSDTGHLGRIAWKGSTGRLDNIVTIVWNANGQDMAFRSELQVHTLAADLFSAAGIARRLCGGGRREDLFEFHFCSWLSEPNFLLSSLFSRGYCESFYMHRFDINRLLIAFVDVVKACRRKESVHT